MLNLYRQLKLRADGPNLLLGVSLLAALFCCSLPVPGAENLRLRDGISFVKDLNQGFPILGEKLDDVAVANGHPTLLFFGASADLNTNRQAKRIVDLYKKYHAANVKFIVVDVDHPLNTAARQLIKAHYQGYIPAEVVFDSSGRSTWSKSGEVELNAMASEIEKVIESKGENKVTAQASGSEPAPKEPPAK
jgi:hypothetical protein